MIEWCIDVLNEMCNDVKVRSRHNIFRKELWTFFFLYYVYIFILIFYTDFFLDVGKYRDVTQIKFSAEHQNTVV